MTRSLFVSLFLRFLLAAAAVGLVCSLLDNQLWMVKVVAGVVLALFCASMALRGFRHDLRPVEEAAARVGDGAFRAPRVANTDLERLAELLARASAGIDRSLEEAEESREKLEALLDSMQDAVVAVDAAGRIQWTNAKMRRLMTGEAVSSSVRVGHALVQTVRDPEVLACVRDALAQRVLCERRSMSLLPGSIFAVSASPMPGGGAVAVLHDITRIEEVERTQKDFVANVSHELRTPLTSISGYVETLLDHEDSIRPQARDFLKTILKNATRMHRLTEDLLALARVESNETKMHIIPVSARLLVLDAVKSVSGLLQDSDAVLETAELSSDEVMADPDAIVQVLSNLIENAIKYGRPKNGVPQVVVSAEHSLTYPQSVLFKVKDSGQGIASEHLGRIFERFYRVDKARSRELEGTGLGLSIAQHIIHAHGGAIWAESELNRGSTFVFTLPGHSSEGGITNSNS